MMMAGGLKIQGMRFQGIALPNFNRRKISTHTNIKVSRFA